MGKVDSTNILKREVVNDSLMMKMGQSPAKKNHPNVVVILMESMSANLLGTFGNQQPLTQRSIRSISIPWRSPTSIVPASIPTMA